MESNTTLLQSSQSLIVYSVELLITYILINLSVFLENAVILQFKHVVFFNNLSFHLLSSN